MTIIGGVRRATGATWRFISPAYWYGFRRIRPLDDYNEPEAANPLITPEPLDGGLKIQTEPSVNTPPLSQPQWRAPITRPSNDSVPVLTLLGAWTACKDLALPDSNEDACAWVADRQLAAVFDGATESFAARRWVNLIKGAWERDSPIDLATLQHQYADEVNAMDLSWAQEQAASRGSFTTLASIEATAGGLAATCIGDSAILVVRGGRIAQAYPSIEPADYSSVPDALGSSRELLHLGQELLETCTWTIPLAGDELNLVFLATDAVAIWLLEGNNAEPNDRLAAVLEIDGPQEWEQLVTTERGAGRMKADDSTVMVISVQGAA